MAHAGRPIAGGVPPSTRATASLRMSPCCAWANTRTTSGWTGKVRERTVERMGQLVLHDRNGGDFFLAYVIESHHGLEGGLQLIRLRGRRAREIVRVDANRAQGVVTGCCREGARRGLRPERASCGNHPLKHRHVVRHDVTERRWPPGAVTAPATTSVVRRGLDAYHSWGIPFFATYSNHNECAPWADFGAVFVGLLLSQ